MNPLRILWTTYSNSLQRHPLPTKIMAASCIFTISDLATQRLTYDDDGDDDGGEGFSFNYQRALSGTAFGIVGTTYLHHWWNFLEKFVEARFPASRFQKGGKLVNTAVKVLIDQSISAPLYNWSYFFVTNFVHHKSSSSSSSSGGSSMVLSWTDRATHAAEHASSQIGPLMRRHWTIWPPIHFCNFFFVPLPNRVLVQNVVLVGWSGYLSHLNHSSSGHSSTEVVISDEAPSKESLMVAGDEGRATSDDVIVRTVEAKGGTTDASTAAPQPVVRRRSVKLKKRHTVLTGLDVVEEDDDDDEE